jgi:uncharacterized protein (DUF433 family)
MVKGFRFHVVTPTLAPYTDAAMNPIRIDPEIMHGTPCFAGTRVPVKNLFDLIAHGRSLDYFLEQFPTVTREQALAVLDLGYQQAVATAAKPTAA